MVLMLLLALLNAAATAAGDNVAKHDACPAGSRDPHVRLKTDLGEIDIQLFMERAPITVCNFLRYVEEGRYDGGRFFRTVRPDNQRNAPVKIAVVQADIREEAAERFAPIPIERTTATGLHHVDGTVSMARGSLDSATSSFFVSIGPQPELDFGGKRAPDEQGFAAFARVVCGMDVVRRIWRQPASGEQLREPVAIASARLIEGKPTCRGRSGS
jgi:peptidyl-prolyl cis-trans isomerase A (cyclophilin A)